MCALILIIFASIPSSSLNDLGSECCDLTDYDGTFVALSANKDIVDSLINTYQKCIDLLKPFAQ
jgi:hypothetical protein